MEAKRDKRPVDASNLLNLAREAENGALDSVWIGDSLVSKPRLEPVATLAAIAAATVNIEIGTAVLLPALRNPVTLAHSLATVDVLSKGRLILGIGVGGAFTEAQKNDWLSVGVSPSSRRDRLLEGLGIMNRLWREEDVTHSGRYFEFQNVTLDPKPVNESGIPIFLACHYRTGSDAQYRRVHQFADGIIGISDSPDEFREVIRQVAITKPSTNKVTNRFEQVFYMTVNVGRQANICAAEADDFLMSYYGVRHWGDRWGPWGAPEQVAYRMAEYVRAGANHIVVRFASWDQSSQLQLFLNEVVPLFRNQ
jgi:alkanesulfonate monooxygenase SsuD/methylene tetrahydromethanopterin reductase-like flavin-dependent oxidoreductase (luciferase family)